MSHNAFQSEKLQSAFEKLEGKAEILNQNIDAISEDIRALEEKLHILQLPISAQVKVAVSTKFSKEEEDKIKIYEECPFKALESLKWEKDETSGKYRLIYQRLLESEEIPGLSIESMLRPLIECPMPVRLRMHPHLHKIVEVLTEQIEV
ncbi:hypothetical protein [Bdellovibrio sp. HCB337]|uniref:hypothetical protein n=1 Tax=Bdellovibrio sp. HCB337 TaxID=3394358 RepID=UPI0039A62413